MRRLAPYRAVKGGGYSPRSMRYPCASIRPTKGAAGATFTASRGAGNSSFGVPNAPAYLLRAFGTCDTLRGGLRAWGRRPLVERPPCPCCGGPGKLRLSAKGRERLAYLRAVRGA